MHMCTSMRTPRIEQNEQRIRNISDRQKENWMKRMQRGTRVFFSFVRQGEFFFFCECAITEFSRILSAKKPPKLLWNHRARHQTNLMDMHFEWHGPNTTLTNLIVVTKSTKYRDTSENPSDKIKPDTDFGFQRCEQRERLTPHIKFVQSEPRN